MKENVIISLADSNYFELLNELVDSIKRFKEGNNTAICILDAGLTDAQRSILTKKVDDIKPPVMHENNLIELTDRVKLEVRFPNLVDVEAIDPNRLQTVEGASEMFSRLIVAIYDGEEMHLAKDSTTDELVYFLESLNSAQYAKLTEFLNELPTMSHTETVNCAMCGKTRDFELKGLASFFT